MTKLQDIIYKALLRAEDPNSFENLFVILDETTEALSDNFFILEYEHNSSSTTNKEKNPMEKAIERMKNRDE